MAQKKSIAVLVLIETDDERLFPGHLNVKTARETATLRNLIIEHLPDLTRVVAVMSEMEAHLMCLAYEAAMNEAGDGHAFVKPPPDYVPPTRD